MVLEALDKIKEAENQVAKMKRDAEEKMQAYELSCTEEIQQLQKENQLRIQNEMEELENKQNQQLNKEKEQLLKEAETSNQLFAEQFEKNQERMSTFIIERMKKTYGSQ